MYIPNEAIFICAGYDGFAVRKRTGNEKVQRWEKVGNYMWSSKLLVKVEYSNRHTI